MGVGVCNDSSSDISAFEEARQRRRSIISDSDDSDDDEDDSCMSKASFLRMIRKPEVITVMLLVGWVLLGLYMYSSRNWSGLGRPYTFAESVYLMAQILTTVGYGDLTPADGNGRLYTSGYVLFGTVVLSTLVGSLTSRINQHVETQQHVLHHSGKWFNSEFKNFLRSAVLWSCFLAGGTFFWWMFEEQTWDESLYLSIITLTTIGFGDYTVRTVHGELFCTVWMLFGVASFANMVGRFSAWFSDVKGIKKLSRKKLAIMFEDKVIKKCVQEVHQGQNRMSRGEYILVMIKELQLCDRSFIDQLSENFDRLDVDESGFLDEDDIKEDIRELSDSVSAVME